MIYDGNDSITCVLCQREMRCKCVCLQLHPQNVAHHQPFSSWSSNNPPNSRILFRDQPTKEKHRFGMLWLAHIFPRVYLQTPMMSNSASNREEEGISSGTRWSSLHWNLEDTHLRQDPWIRVTRTQSVSINAAPQCRACPSWTIKSAPPWPSGI